MSAISISLAELLRWLIIHSTMPKVCGASLAVLINKPNGQPDILVYRRDNDPTIPYPNKLDLPGGGLEENEDIEDCALRETLEELHVSLQRKQIGWIALYPRANGTDKNAFLVAHATEADIADMHIGNEGDNCQRMPIDEYLDHPDAIIDHTDRLRDYFNGYSMIGEIVAVKTIEQRPAAAQFTLA